MKFQVFVTRKQAWGMESSFSSFLACLSPVWLSLGAGMFSLVQNY